MVDGKDTRNGGDKPPGTRKGYWILWAWQPEVVYDTVPHRKSSTVECPNGRGHNASVVMVVDGVFNSESLL